MVSKETVEEYLGKWVFVKIIDDKVQVGILKKGKEGDFILENKTGNRYTKTAFTPDQVSRITTEGSGIR